MDMIFFEGWTIPHAKANCSNLHFEIALLQQDKPFKRIIWQAVLETVYIEKAAGSLMQ
jgi:hypothetical protein